MLIKTATQADLVRQHFEEFHSVFDSSSISRANGDAAVAGLISFTIDTACRVILAPVRSMFGGPRT